MELAAVACIIGYSAHNRAKVCHSVLREDAVLLLPPRSESIRKFFECGNFLSNGNHPGFEFFPVFGWDRDNSTLHDICFSRFNRLASHEVAQVCVCMFRGCFDSGKFGFLTLLNYETNPPKPIQR